jgi:pyridoxal phosphate enzyme (YggS family)
MGVSKFHGRDKMEEALRGGIRLFGESRVQEAAEKCAGFRQAHPEAELHFIGGLQRNKAKLAISLFDCIQSVDRESLIDVLGNLADRPLDILLELKTGEETKTGFPNEDSLFRGAEKVSAYPCLRVRGLMTIAPYTEDSKRVRAAFRALASARDKAAARFPSWDWSCLSMGMSDDFEIALEEGSTMVRIGTAIFGSRS